MAHPYKVYKVVPNPPSNIDPKKINAEVSGKDFDAHQRKVSARNLALIPEGVYAALKGQPVQAT